jgi:hypothetical protein
MKINWKKHYTENRGFSNPFISDGYSTIGLISFESESQDLTHLNIENKEYIIGKIDNCKFPLSFTITAINKKYKLTTISPISLRTYEELSLKIENWGEFDSIKTCMSRAMSVLKGFQTYFLTDKENDGNYYKY